MIRAASYVRVPASHQTKRDLSLADRAVQCRACCEREGWEIVEVFSEPDALARDDDRPALQEMIYGSDADLMTADSICADEASLKKIDLCAPVHLASDELEFGDLTLGLAVRPQGRNGRAHRRFIPCDSVGE